MKLFVFAFTFFLSLTTNAQLIEGTLLDDGRKMTSEQAFVIEGFKDGWAKFSLAVNIEGEVTGAKQISSNLKSTPATGMIRDYVKKFTFEPGTYYPKFHHVVVKITMVKPLPVELEEETTNSKEQ